MPVDGLPDRPQRDLLQKLDAVSDVLSSEEAGAKTVSGGQMARAAWSVRSSIPSRVWSSIARSCILRVPLRANVIAGSRHSTTHRRRSTLRSKRCLTGREQTSSPVCFLAASAINSPVVSRPCSMPGICLLDLELVARRQRSDWPRRDGSFKGMLGLPAKPSAGDVTERRRLLPGSASAAGAGILFGGYVLCIRYRPIRQTVVISCV